MTIWDKLNHFKQYGNDHWGNSDKMNPMLLLMLDQLRDAYGSPFVVFEGFTTTWHSPGSMHYLGSAVDFYIKDDLDFYSQITRICALLAEVRMFCVGWQNSRCCWVTASEITGLGIYPDNRIPSFHLDIRGKAARWGRANGKYVGFKQAIEYTRAKQR